MKSMNPHKLSSSTKRILSEAAETESDRELDLLIRVDSSVAAEETEAAIRGAGGRIRTHTGDILSLTLPLRQLDALSQLDSVIYVEAAEPMYLESPPDEEPGG
jgi:hypothetical protein